MTKSSKIIVACIVACAFKSRYIGAYAEEVATNRFSVDDSSFITEDFHSSEPSIRKNHVRSKSGSNVDAGEDSPIPDQANDTHGNRSKNESMIDLRTHQWPILSDCMSFSDALSKFISYMRDKKLDSQKGEADNDEMTRALQVKKKKKNKKKNKKKTQMMMKKKKKKKKTMMNKKPSNFPSAHPSRTPTGVPSSLPSPTMTCRTQLGCDPTSIAISAGTRMENYVIDFKAQDGSDINDARCWNTTLVEDMESSFAHDSSFNVDISCWDTSSATSMAYMFSGASSFNQPIGQWDTSKVISMRSMFNNARAFNQDVSEWDTSQVTSTTHMFNVDGGGTSAFNADISTWDLTSISDMSNMFEGATSFNQCLDSWKPLPDGTSVTDIFKNSGCQYPTDMCGCFGSIYYTCVLAA